MKYFCDDQRHLVCYPYSVDNLHEMAKDLAIKRCWYSTKPYSHYDIPKRRIKEISDKCFVVRRKDIINIIKGTIIVNDITALKS